MGNHLHPHVTTSPRDDKDDDLDGSWDLVPEVRHAVQTLAAETGQFEVRLDAIGSTAIQVSWGEPSGEYAIYKIRYRLAKSKWKSAKSEEGANFINLKGLQVDSEYEVQVVNKAVPVKKQNYCQSVVCRTCKEQM